MSIARETFCDRISTIRNAIDDFALQDIPYDPVRPSHNLSVRIIRNGLAVQCYNIFEDFVKDRTAELLVTVSGSGVAFSYLPERLQRAVTVDVISAISNQLKQREKPDQIGYVQDCTRKIYSTQSATIPRELADIGFFHTKSNVSRDEFRNSLAAFGVQDPWKQISRMCSRIGIMPLPASDEFDSFVNRRHKAAHDANMSVSVVDLIQSIDSAIGFALCFDVLASRAANIIRRLSGPSGDVLLVENALIPLRFIKYYGDKYGEIKETGKKYIARNEELSRLIDGAFLRSNRENGALIVYDDKGTLKSWMV